MGILDWDTGMSELPKLAVKSRNTSFLIKDEEFLKAILYDGKTLDILQEIYVNYFSNIEIIKKKTSPYIENIIKGFYHRPRVEFIFDNTELPEKYRDDLENISKEIPFYLMLVEGRYSYQGFLEPPTVMTGGIDYNLAVFRPQFKYNRLIAASLKRGTAVISNGHDGLDLIEDIELYHSLKYRVINDDFFESEDNNN
ncbi:MAG: hypothetical protein KAI18_02225 [Candidatus Aenigmarchaeota archaeon]|nr:hypothetical protein [Candidatus Aenigmarchaeota archaeon]